MIPKMKYFDRFLLVWRPCSSTRTRPIALLVSLGGSCLMISLWWLIHPVWFTCILFYYESPKDGATGDVSRALQYSCVFPNRLHMSVIDASYVVFNDGNTLLQQVRQNFCLNCCSLSWVQPVGSGLPSLKCLDQQDLGVVGFYSMVGMKGYRTSVISGYFPD